MTERVLELLQSTVEESIRTGKKPEIEIGAWICLQYFVCVCD